MPKFIISGGGTGGHIFPAIAIANQLKTEYSNCEILFVGALGKMEMEKVPAAGYKIIGLPISGISRSLTLKNLLVPFKLIRSLNLASKIIKQFKPDAVIGVGGYASAAVLYVASRKGIPTLIQEQNSMPGITNKLLAKKVSVICTAYEGLEVYFPKEKIVLTGNPVRQDIAIASVSKADAQSFFGLPPTQKTVLVIGGSLGARSINQTLMKNMDAIKKLGVSLIWQTGKTSYHASVQAAKGFENVVVKEFIREMNLAYAAADVIISRAGALAVSELCIVGKPCILVPYPYASEDHQTQNAMQLVAKTAALIVKDSELDKELIPQLDKLISNSDLMATLETNCKKIAKPEATIAIVNEIKKLIKS
jgi:UDP-N-acetylglucosamine--N-acetylmuramyl-(pentapeptide) pyrophosphoryl-undecaprenol N-acetylglucosamine transferase